MNLSIDVIALVIGAVLAIVWLVRLEGRLNGKADASTVQTVAASVDTIKASTIAAVDAVRASTVAAVDHIKSSVDGAKSDIAVLQQAAKAADETKIEVVRLQEQIKHLTDLIEKWLRPAVPNGPGRRRSPTSASD
jgi:hypothetical protein